MFTKFVYGTACVTVHACMHEVSKPKRHICVTRATNMAKVLHPYGLGLTLYYHPLRGNMWLF